ncbi:hypothetical protein D0863_02088 [Hortaea werneckii]|uniref:Methyltransferase domain-containing protein n=1 Tax=Hortaea werneckii TaxID=91943 RepID=A0A3M7EID3_HORWE|nr:hypothetical protein D0863_02088 [Hortaea werneckii]
MPDCGRTMAKPISRESVRHSRRFFSHYTMGGFPNRTSSGRTVATAANVYRYENGRRYHSYRDGAYWQPNDSKKNDHQAIVHHICLLTLNDQLYLAPIGSDPKRILDLGTGAGIWATDMADRFPTAQVIGTDLSPVPPGMQPHNVTFEIDDCCSEWVFPNDHFDFVHIRGLFGSVADWPKLYREAYRHLRPGAYIEQVEWSVHNRSGNGTLSPNHTLAKFSQNAIQAGTMTGKTFEIAENMAGLIREAGFEDVVEKRFKWPVGPWSTDPKLKEIGRWNLLNWEEGMEGWVMAAYTRVLGWTYQQVQDWLQEVRKALRDRKHNVYHEVRLVYARKPQQ